MAYVYVYENYARHVVHTGHPGIEGIILDLANVFPSRMEGRRLLLAFGGERPGLTGAATSRLANLITFHPQASGEAQVAFHVSRGSLRTRTVQAR